MYVGRRPRDPRKWIIAALVSGVMFASACGGDATPTTPEAAPELGFGRPASLAELTGPWRPQPLSVDGAIAAEADRVCRSDPEFPPGLGLVAIDARGGGKLMAQYAGVNTTADCTYLEIDANGVIEGSLSGWGQGIQAPAPGRIGIVGQMGVGGRPRGGGPPDPNAWSAVTGQAGAGIAVVVIDVPGRGRVQATLRGGWYLAWWPGECCGPAPLKVLAYDASGSLLEQITQ